MFYKQESAETLCLKNETFLRHVLSKFRPDLLIVYETNYLLSSSNDKELVNSSGDEVVDVSSVIAAALSRSDSYLILPQIMPFRQETADLYKQMLTGYPRLSSDRSLTIENIYINEETADPQLLKNILAFRSILLEIGIDPNIQHTTTGSYGSFLLILDPGDGKALDYLIENIPHRHLVIAVPGLEYFKKSYPNFDWLECWNYYCLSKDRTISVFIADQPYSEQGIIGSMATQALVGIDHSLIYHDSTADSAVVSLKDACTGRRLDAMINYLGFTMDEYNMIWHSWFTLLSEPRVFRHVTTRLNAPFVVVASGPSLDNDVCHVRELSSTHYVIAAASSVRTLLMHGVVPDLLVLLERGTHEVENYLSLKREYPDLNIKLIASVTCASKLHELFGESAIYFRPGTSASTIFAPTPKNILQHEGPQTINAALSLAASLTSEAVVLVGADLGAIVPDKPRSKDAVGISPRNLNIVAPGNLRDSIYTDNELQDGGLIAEDCIEYHSRGVKFFNASDGLKIKGAEPIPIKKYLENVLPKYDTLCRDSDLDLLRLWWTSLSRYSLSDIDNRWRAARVRTTTHNFFNDLRQVFGLSLDSWKHQATERLNQILDTSITLRNQFVIRAFRGVIQKSALAISRQLLVLKDDEQKAAEFYEKSVSHMLSELDEYEYEMYCLCDELEANLVANLRNK
jgi:hypothetical protein